MSEDKSIDPKLNEALKGIWDSLTDEQKEKAKDCKSMDELMKLAGKENVELPDEAPDMISDGGTTGYIRRWRDDSEDLPPFIFPLRQRCKPFCHKVSP